MQHIPVRKLFWDALTLTLETQAHRLARDIAAVLGQPDAPLLKALRDDKVSAYLLEEAADAETDDLEAFRCDHVCEVGQVLIPCRQPILWGSATKCCPAHVLHPSPRGAYNALPLLRPVAIEGRDLYCDRAIGLVYTLEGVPCGRLTQGVLTLFQVG